MDDNKILEKIESFSKKWTDKNPERAKGYCHNIYYLVSEDMDGNITNEAFSVNVMTDYGFSKIYTTQQSVGTILLFIGSGVTDPEPTSSKVMESYIGTGTTSDSSFSYVDDIYYSDTQTVVSRSRLIVSYFDYTVFNEDKTVTEIGVGTDQNNLLYHSRVYDSEGDPSSFVKKLYEKLTIYVYVSISCKPAAIIDRNWNKGIYALFRPYWFLKDQYNQRLSTVYGYLMPSFNTGSAPRRSGDTYWKLCTMGISDNVCTIGRTDNLVTNKLITDTYDYISDIVICDINTSTLGPQKVYTDSKFLMLYKPKLETPEKIESYNLFTDGYDSTQLKYVFGYGTDNRNHRVQGYIPVTDFDISGTDAGMWMYNCQDDDWNIPDTFVNAKNACYDCEMLVYTLLTNMYLPSFSANTSFRVFLNTRPDIPITKINRTGSFYATDTYWDPSSWEQIIDVDNIPQLLQTKRFFITLTTQLPGVSSWPYTVYGDRDGYATLRVTRDQTYHSIQPNTPYYFCDYGKSSTSWRSSSSTVSGKSVSNDTYGYIATLDWLLYPGTDDPNATTYTDASATNNEFWYRYRIKGFNDTSPHECLLWNTKNGDKIIVQGTNSAWNNGFRVYTPNVDPSIAPTYEDVLIDDGLSFSSNPHWSYSDEGYVAMSYISGNNRVNKTFILDVYGTNGPEIKTLDDHKYAHIIDLTHYICALNTNISDHLSFDIIDMRTMDIVQSFDFVAGITFDGICAYDDFVYVRVAVSSTNKIYLYQISTQSLVELTMDSALLNITSGLSFRTHIQRAVRGVGNTPACMVMLGYSDSPYSTNVPNHILFNSATPTNIVELFTDYDAGEPREKDNLSAGIKNQCAEMKYINNNKQLLLTFSNYRVHLVDIGRLVNKQIQQSASMTLYYRLSYNTGNRYTSAIYKNSVAMISPFYVDSSKYICSAQMYPIESFLPHKVIGYTKTICSYNNPKNISSCKGLKFQLSNDITNWTPPVGE